MTTFPTAQTPQPPPIRPSGWWYVLAGGIAAATIAAVPIIMVTAVVGLINVFDLVHFEAPGVKEIDLDEPGRYVIYMEEPRRMRPEAARRWSEPELTVTLAETGATLPTRTSGGSMTINNRDYSGLVSFKLAEPATVRIESTFSPEATGEEAVLAVGQDFLRDGFVKFFCGVFAIPLIGLLGMGSAITIFIVTLVRRSNPARAARYATPAPPAAPPGQPPAGHGGV